MIVRQSKNTFIRTTEKYGYITNQLTWHDRSYNETGSDYLRMITREAQDVESIVDQLLPLYCDVERAELKKDFVDFIKDLAEDHFLVIGDTKEELDEKDLSFSYQMDNPKTATCLHPQQTKQKVHMSTQDFFLEEVQGNPLISNLQFELSSRCNERCIHCYIPNAKKDNGFDMPLQKVKSILDEFTAMGGLHVTISGGEAFLHKDLMEICRYCREKDLRITILSNLTLLKKDHIPILKEVNISLIQTSLYSMNPEVHDAITTVKGSFAKTKAAIELIVENNIPVQIACPIMKANHIGYGEVINYAKTLKTKAYADYILSARADLTVDNLANRLSIEETEVVIRDIIENDIDYHRFMDETPPASDFIAMDKERYLKRQVCGVGYDNCCITANGDVYPCAGWQSYILGNVYKQSLREIWEDSPRIKELRKVTMASFPKCVDCEAHDFCAACLVRNYNESGGDMFKINEHFCKVAFLNKRLVEEYQIKG